MPEYTNPSAELRARVALEKYRFHNTHSLGQNFLLSESLISSLLDEARIAPDDHVLEIGGEKIVLNELCGKNANVQFSIA